MLYIGMMKLGFSEKEVGRMTFKKWRMLFKAYKQMFDNELFLTRYGTTYEAQLQKNTIDDVIPF